MATKEKALQEKEGKMPSNKTNNTVNGTGGTPIHVNTLQVNTTRQNLNAVVMNVFLMLTSFVLVSHSSLRMILSE